MPTQYGVILRDDLSFICQNVSEFFMSYTIQTICSQAHLKRTRRLSGLHSLYSIFIVNGLAPLQPKEQSAKSGIYFILKLAAHICFFTADPIKLYSKLSRAIMCSWPKVLLETSRFWDVMIPIAFGVRSQHMVVGRNPHLRSSTKL